MQIRRMAVAWPVGESTSTMLPLSRTSPAASA
jgi:hypothetical protein